MHVYIPFERYSDKVLYVCRLSNWLQDGTDTGTMDLACCCLHKSFDIYYLLQGAVKYDCVLDQEVRQSTKHHGFFVICHNFDHFAVLLARRILFFAPVAVCWSETESSRLLHVPSLLCLAYHTSVLFGDDDFDMHGFNNWCNEVHYPGAGRISSDCSSLHFVSLLRGSHTAEVGRERYVSSAEQAFLDITRVVQYRA